MPVDFFTNSRAARSDVSIEPKEDLPLVIDAGFDAFVRQHWDSLVAGDTHRFQFPFADRESLVPELFATSVREAGMSERLHRLRGSWVHHYPICVRKVLPDDTLVRELSGNRANAVKEALVQKYQLDQNQLNSAGVGWERPADPQDPGNHAKNRRVEIRVFSAEQE